MDPMHHSEGTPASFAQWVWDNGFQGFPHQLDGEDLEHFYDWCSGVEQFYTYFGHLPMDGDDLGQWTSWAI